MSDGIKQDFDIIRRDIRNHVPSEDARLAISDFTRLVEERIQSRLEAAEKVCETAEELEIAQEPLSVLTAEIKQEKALANWRKVKEEER